MRSMKVGYKREEVFHREHVNREHVNRGDVNRGDVLRSMSVFYVCVLNITNP